jgi:hypothetical protein
VGRVDTHFHRLQPVAVDHALEREGVGGGRGKAVEPWQGGRLARPHIGEQDAALLHHRIGLLPNIGAHAAALGLGRRLQALPRDVEQPAVERATQAAVLKPSKGEIGAAVRTGALEQAIAALVVPKQDEVFPEEANRLERTIARQFVDQRGGVPVAPHQLARRRTWPRPGEEIILLGAQHRLIPSLHAR